jgi:hypothetical protein
MRVISAPRVVMMSPASSTSSGRVVRALIASALSMAC